MLSFLIIFPFPCLGNWPTCVCSIFLFHLCLINAFAIQISALLFRLVNCRNFLLKIDAAVECLETTLYEVKLQLDIEEHDWRFILNIEIEFSKLLRM